MGIVLWLSDESFSDGVLVAITNDLVQEFIPTNPIIVVVDLPKWTGSQETRVNLVRRESLEGLEEVWQSLFIFKLKDHVDMVWHNHDTHPSEAFIGFEPVEAFKNNIWDAGSCQDRCSVLGSDCNEIVCARYEFSAFPQLAMSFIRSLVHIFFVPSTAYFGKK